MELQCVTYFCYEMLERLYCHDIPYIMFGMKTSAFLLVE